MPVSAAGNSNKVRDAVIDRLRWG